MLKIKFYFNFIWKIKYINKLIRDKKIKKKKKRKKKEKTKTKIHPNTSSPIATFKLGHQ